MDSHQPLQFFNIRFKILTVCLYRDGLIIVKKESQSSLHKPCPNLGSERLKISSITKSIE